MRLVNDSREKNQTKKKENCDRCHDEEANHLSKKNHAQATAQNRNK